MDAGGTSTLLFTDLAGSTELLDRLGDAAFDALLREHFAALRDVLSAHGGREVKSLGDGLMVALPGPTAAVACATEMQRRTAEHNAGRAPDVLLRLRIGINTGEVISEGADCFGMAVVIAKRLCDRADPGQILLADVVRLLTGADSCSPLNDVGTLTLKGVSDPVRAWAVEWSPDGVEDRRATAADVAGDAVAADPASAGLLALPPALAFAGRDAFVGRSGPLARIAVELDRTRPGARRMLLLAGEAGIGKTRLAAQAAAAAHAAGATVLFGRSDEDPLQAFQPFAEALAHAGLERAIATDSDAETDRHRLFARVSAALDDLGARRPVLLVLDDLQWADRPTLQLLRFIMRSPQPSPLLVLATVRDTDVSAGHPLFEALADLRRLHVLDRLDLDGLAQREVGELIAAWAGHPAPAHLVPVLWEQAEGHPFFTEELLRDLLESGALHEHGGRLRATGAREHVPAGVSDVVRSRLDRLPEETVALLRIAAVLGREFRLDLLESVAGTSTDALLSALEDAAGARVVEFVPGSDERVAFTHVLVRDVLYEQLLPARRSRLHEQIAAALEGDPGACDELAAQVSHHLFASGGRGDTRARAVDYALRAGDHAGAHLAYEEAARHYRVAIGALEGNAEDAERRCRALLALGDVQWQAGELSAAREAFTSAAAEAETIGVPVLYARAVLGLAGRIGYRVGVIDRPLIAMLERSLRALADDEPAETAMVTAALAEVSASSTSYEQRRKLATAALSTARALDDPRTLAFVLRRTIWALWGPDNAEERLADGQELLELATRLGDDATAIEARLTLLTAQLELGLAADALDEMLAELDALVRASQQPYYQWLLSATQATRALYDHPLEEAETLARGALEAIHVPHHPAALELFGTQMAYIRYLQGRTAELHASLTAYAELFPHVGAFRAARALALAETGQEDAARAELDAIADDGFAMVGHDPMWFTTMNALTLVISTLGDRERAEQLYERLGPYSGGYCALGGIGAPSCSLHRHLGMLALAAGRVEGAVDHLEMALGLNESTGVVVSVVLTQLELARALVARDGDGDADRAQVLLQSAAATGDRLGMERVAHKARALLTPAHPAGRDMNGVAQVIRLPRRVARAGGEARAALSTRTRELVGRRTGGVEDEELQRLFGNAAAQRALLTGMAASFQPRMAFGFRGEIQLELRSPPGRPPDWWTLEIRRLTAAAQRRVASDPVVTLRVDVPTFIRLFGGELNPIAAWIDGLLDLDGDVLFAPRLIELFGGVRPFDDLTWSVEPPPPPAERSQEALAAS